jgi:hypothetical protein
MGTTYEKLENENECVVNQPADSPPAYNAAISDPQGANAEKRKHVSLCECTESWWKWCCFAFCCGPCAHYRISKKSGFGGGIYFLLIWTIIFTFQVGLNIRSQTAVEQFIAEEGVPEDVLFEAISEGDPLSAALTNELGTDRWVAWPLAAGIIFSDPICLGLYFLLALFSLGYLIQAIRLRCFYSKEIKGRPDCAESCIVHWCCTPCSIGQMGADHETHHFNTPNQYTV